MTDMLSIGRSALMAYSGALTTVGENVANAQTPGYVRRAPDLRQMPPGHGQSPVAGTGVRAAGVQRQWNQFLADTARGDASSAGRENIRYDGAKQIEAALDDGIGGVGQSMTGMFNAARTLAADPSSSASQTQFRHNMASVATAFRRSAAALGSVADQGAAQIDATLATANSQLSDLAAINQRIALARPNSSELAALADQRDGHLTALAASLGATSTIDASGRATVTLGGGDAPDLVSGTSASALRRGDSGAIVVTNDRGTGSVHVTGGRIGGLQATVAQAQGRHAALDALAADVVATVNDWSAQGRTPRAASGQALLQATSAADIAVTPALADPLPMASAAGTPNGNLVALASVRQMSGLEQRWDAIVANQAQTTATAKITADASQLLLDGSAAKLDAAGAVDLDNEAADLIRYQQAYQAAARVIKAADEAISTILQLL